MPMFQVRELTIKFQIILDDNAHDWQSTARAVLLLDAVIFATNACIINCKLQRKKGSDNW